ncbi:MAG: tetratricopeptide repeat protein, partial [Leptolyngbya sp. SIO1D8]|nr:tetratricopeptide repeat protein [Leptolyngbya sp. SIO1D8]
MRQRLTVAIYLLVSLSVAIPSALAQSRGVNYISDIEGQAEVNGNRAHVGDFVHHSDELRVLLGGNVGIVCHNETREQRFPLGTYIITDYCTEVSSSRTGRRRPPRDFDSQLPYVISPRNTALLGVTQPMIRWNSLEGAQEYRVLLFTDSPDNPVWTTQISTPEVRYDGPELQRDTRYRLEITADNGLSSSADIAVGFTLLSESEADRITREVAVLEEINLNPDAEALGLALSYQGYEHEDPAQDTDSPLNQAALEVLQARIDDGTDNSLIYVMQGDIYFSVGLPLRAQEHYQQALTLATKTGQLQGQAGSQDGLALLAQGRGELSEAIAYTEEALALYEVMGDAE